ncbi:PREDICTED: aminopeptidase O isoform X16 [Cercocebus atys]|uniref:Aminopeptidase O (putative) n=1 Tax=Cercocebus atys TaxID=9531 RepID=A0A2K5LNU7_CERAT|nr:PREDICTED: aminopeptidase O isoform X16 [Cercocebus atys]XP_011902088.1 PREDICTED: aminopeptidase O isoform X16 [Cercocebus atys]
MDMQLDPAGDDLPLMANTSHILVKHYVLDLDVDFESQVIEGTIVLFLEDGDRFKKQNRSVEEACQSESNKGCKLGMPEPCHVPVTNARTFSSEVEYNDCAICSKGEKDTSDKDGNHDNQEHAAGISSSKRCCDTGNHGSEEFLLVLDCCDLSVLKVEEVDVAAVPGMEKFTRSPELTVVSEELRNQIVRELVTLPANRWREQLDYYARCSQAAGCGELLFDTDTWSLQIRKTGAQTATDFPHAIRIWYKTKPEGRSVTWTSDQSGRPCVYTVGSPVNNRALFPCQEPPVAMSTWQATVRAAASFVVLMSGENSAKPTQLWEGCSSWYYYVTMPMPASTFTIAVGCWTEVKMEPCSSGDSATETPFSPSEADFRRVGVCSHMEYPCRFQNASATTQQIIPHRVFAPVCLTGACQETLLQLIPPCLSAAHSVLGTHPFSRLDVLIVPANFPSLGMARPNKDKTGHTSDSGASVIKHGLNPEKIFMQVHYLKGYFLLRFLAEKLGDETYFSFLRKFVHAFHGQLILSQDFLQMLLENIPEEKRLELSVENIYQDWLESSGIPKPLQRERRAGAECGLARQVRAEVTKWIRVNRRPRKRKRREREAVFEKLLPDQLVLLLEHLLEQKTLSHQTLRSLQRTYQLQDQDAEVRHRWCELIVKHKFTKAYESVERFLQEDQAMGVYLYGELMVSEDARQQQLARRCFERTREQMDRSSAQVVADMLF